jgi:chorismate dehydratase
VLPRVLSVGSVSFLNAKPLIFGLETQPDLNLVLDVPSRLLGGLLDGRFDVALLPVIDYQRMPDLSIVPSGGIGCDGPTLTVRIFSPVPIDQIRTLACDTDSHTSVALAKVILAERHGLRPRFVDLSDPADARDRHTAKLLIGDKVVCEEPVGLPHQLDLGEEWKHLTGLPFVFAVWTARGGVELGDLPDRLERAKRDGLAHVDQIVTRYALPRGWPENTARRYLTEYLQFDIGPAQLKAIRLFHELAHKHGALKHPPREVDVYAKLDSGCSLCATPSPEP